jgi:rifampicin phosphotransferase
VQAMVDAEVSGVMFTVNPNAPDELVIESNWGLGESVVSGEVTPDHFIVSRESGGVLRETVAMKRKMITREGATDVPIGQQQIPSLQRGQVAELAQLGRRIEDFYGAPQDIEWAFADGKFYLLQARPITTLTDTAQLEGLRLAEIERLTEKADEGGTVWSRFNLSEVLPAPLPMTWGVIKDFMSGTGGFGLTYRELGFLPSPRVDEEGVLELICGRIYYNLSREAELYFHGFPLEHDFEALKRDPQKASYPQAAVNVKRATAGFWFKFPYYVVKMVAADRKLKRTRRDFDKTLTDKILPEFDEYVRAQREISLADLSDEAVIEKFNEWRQKTLVEFAKDALKATVFAGFSLQQLDEKLRKCFDEKEAADFTRALITGLTGDLTVETNLKLWAVSQGELELSDFLEQYGHRAAGEFELAQPRWREDPSYIEQIIESFRANPDADPAKHLDAQKERREAAETRLATGFKDPKKGVFRRQIEREIDFVQRYMPFRETAKFYLMLGYELIRKATLELDRRYGLDGGIFYLMPDELEPLTTGENFQSTITERRTERTQLLRIELPDAIFSDSLHRIGEPQPIEASDELKGLGVSVGVATGKAYVLLEPNAAQIPEKDYILVCPSTDPGWTPLFLHAAALVMERGGMLSHGAVVAREYGIPAVVNVPDATKRLQNGQRVRVDGNRGVVSILSEDTNNEM